MTENDEFLQAVTAGDLPRVESMLRNHSLATTTTGDGVPVLLHALHEGHAGVARAIASRLPSMTLHEAAGLGDLDRVRATLTLRPSELHTPGADGNAPLVLAVMFAQLEVTRFLLDQGADPNGVSKAGGVQGVPPLHAAIRIDQPGVAATFVDLLLNAGADATRTAGGGWTSVHAAAAMGYREVASKLIDHGALPTALAENGQTPAHVAEEFGFDSVASWLSEAGGDD